MLNVPGQVHTKPDERSRLIKLGKALGHAIEELITLVAPSTFFRWCRDEHSGKKKLNHKGGQRKPREIRELVIEIATTTGFGYARNASPKSTSASVPRNSRIFDTSRNTAGVMGNRLAAPT